MKAKELLAKRVHLILEEGRRFDKICRFIIKYYRFLDLLHISYLCMDFPSTCQKNSRL